MKPERIFAEYKTSSLTENLCLLIEGENGFTEDENLRLEYTFSDGRLKAWATPVSQNESVILSCFMVSGKVETPSTKDTRYFLNGFQSWTDTQELSADEKETTISHLPKFVKNKFALDSYGDYNFCRQNLPKGQFHGWTYAYVRNRDTFEFAGSLTELKAACEGELSSKSFGLFFINAKTNTFELYSDSEIINYKISGKTLMADCLFVTGSEDEVFDSYFSTAKIEKPNVKPVLGWTSWYNFYEKINSSILIEQIEHIENYNRNNQDKKLEIFQIDDGYQMAVGDWLFVDKEKFPEGLEPVITKAKNSGLVPGIWWAPFSAAKSSRLAKEHPDWLLKNEKGKDVCCGSNWGGFYGLDIYNEEVRAYIKKVCRHFIDNLGIGLFKVDFLYSAIIT
ncbi:MAG: alpha-galactosidase, partial [Treponema sp.]|nr:alpha-galactosidase [Treponema sp.]